MTQQFEMFPDPDSDRFFERLRAEKKGIYCPCCLRYAKIYPRHINASMGRSLIWLYKACQKLTTDEWIDLPRIAPRFVINSREHGRLIHWNLIEAKPNLNDPSKKDLGLHRITKQGRLFVLNQTSVPKTAFMWDNAVLYWSEQQVTIIECLGKKFHYQQMMDENI